MKNLQSWVETTVPPGYALELIDGVWTVWDFSLPGCVAWAPEKHVVCRAAWRRWTAAVLRGRGDVRAVGGVDYAKSGGIAWVVCRDDGTLRCWTQGAHVGHCPTGGYYSCADDLAHHLVIYKHTEDLDQAMARFAMLVLAARGPVTP